MPGGREPDEDGEEEEEEEEEEEVEEEVEEEEPLPIRVGDRFYYTLDARWWSVVKVNKKWPKIQVWPSLSRIDVPVPSLSTHSHSCLCPPRTTTVSIGQPYTTD